jgi:hypothetical protein
MSRQIFSWLAVVAALSVGVTATAQTPTRRLTLKEAIEQGLQHNLRVLVAGTQIEEAQGRASAPVGAAAGGARR